MHDYQSRPRTASLQEIVLDVDDERQPGLKNRMLPRNSSVKADLNNTLADNLSDDDINKTQSDEGLLNDKKVSSPHSRLSDCLIKTSRVLWDASVVRLRRLPGGKPSKLLISGRNAKLV